MHAALFDAPPPLAKASFRIQVSHTAWSAGDQADRSLPDPLPTGKAMTLECPKCTTSRTIQLEASGKDNLGFRWALEQATFQLGIKDPLAFASLRTCHNTPAEMPLTFLAAKSQQIAFQVLLQQLSEVHALHSASFPLLALRRTAIDRALNTAVSLYAENRYGQAQALAQGIMEGLEAILPVGHPVRAVQRTVHARLASIAPDGTELKDDRQLAFAHILQQSAYKESEIAFGKKGILLQQLRQELASLESDLNMRRRMYSS
jgi:hypothetical protein